jgi:hypothetical protein
MAKRKIFSAEQIIMKLREAEVLLSHTPAGHRRQEHKGSLPRAGDQRTDLLSLAEGIWGVGVVDPPKPRS